MIIQIKVQKGGVGKSFITANLAHLYALQNKKTVILTTDTQNSIIEYFTKDFDVTTMDKTIGFINSVKSGKIKTINLRKNLDFIPLERELNDFAKEQLELRFMDIQTFVRKLKEVYDYVIIDSTPTLNTTLDRFLLGLSDEIIVPVYADKLTISGAINILLDYKDKVKAIIFNKYSENLKLHKMYFEAIKEACLETGVMIKKIPNWQYLTELMERGNTIWESKSKKQKLDEVQNVFDNLAE